MVDLIEIAVAVRSDEPVASVELRIDGEIVQRWKSPPYRLVHDFGLSGRSRALEARAVGATGQTAVAFLESPAVRIHDVVDLELQQLYVTVEDRRGKRRLGLSREAFTVLDNDHAQEIVTFAAGRIPFSTILLIDSSESMKGRRLDSAMAGARRFIAGMRELDRTQLVAFSDRVLAATAVGSRSELESAPARQVAPAGGTAIRDHLFLAASLLERRQGRRAVVLLSDGWDQLSVLSVGEIERAVERAQSTLYWVRLKGDEPSSRRRGERLLRRIRDFEQLRFRFHPGPSSWADEQESRDAYRALEDLVSLTGGRILTAESVIGLEKAMSEVLAELHEQYALGYYPRPRGTAGDWRPIEVRLRARGLKLRTRAGYVER